MDAVFRAIAIYLFIWLVFRIAGKRTLSDMTSFDFVLLLIISETTQVGLTGDDKSLTNSVVLIASLVGIDIVLSLWKQWSPRVEKIIDGVPLVILVNGVPLTDRLKKERIDVGDILDAARERRGLERLEQIKYAVLECNGCISIIPQDDISRGTS